MTPLDLAEYSLKASTVMVVLALVCNVLILVGRRQPVRQAQQAMAADTSVDVATAVPLDRRRGPARYGTAFAWIAIVLVSAAMIARMIETGHAPFSNQHEFAVAFAWGILAAHLFFEHRYRVRTLAVVVLPLAAAFLVYALTLDTGPGPLMPALQNGWLLTLHVIFAILAYGAAAVAFAAAALYLIHPHVRRFRARALMPRADLLDEIAYRAGIITFPLLTVMIVLGAIWADIAWGRYWGWDPKETAALVTWLIYGAYLHARVVRDWRGKRAAWLIVLGFAAVLFTYFGNHFFGGLHSYV
jgi:cytochrome c-type biogenesis protein CcsB